MERTDSSIRGGSPVWRLAVEAGLAHEGEVERGSDAALACLLASRGYRGSLGARLLGAIRRDRDESSVSCLWSVCWGAPSKGPPLGVRPGAPVPAWSSRWSLPSVARSSEGPLTPGLLSAAVRLRTQPIPLGAWPVFEAVFRRGERVANVGMWAHSPRVSREASALDGARLNRRWTGTKPRLRQALLHVKQPPLAKQPRFAKQPPRIDVRLTGALRGPADLLRAVACQKPSH
jgi:hypothetical protein